MPNTNTTPTYCATPVGGYNATRDKANAGIQVTPQQAAQIRASSLPTPAQANNYGWKRKS